MLKVSLKMVPGPSQLTRLLHEVLQVQVKPLFFSLYYKRTTNVCAASRHKRVLMEKRLGLRDLLCVSAIVRC